jgi:hypothetical protein
LVDRPTHYAFCLGGQTNIGVLIFRNGLDPNGDPVPWARAPLTSLISDNNIAGSFVLARGRDLQIFCCFPPSANGRFEFEINGDTCAIEILSSGYVSIVGRPWHQPALPTINVLEEAVAITAT